MDEKLSIVIPLYNCQDYIERCIESCEKQDLDNYEIIVIDDGSTDCSFSIVKQLQERHTNIILITKKNGGAASARNIGLECAKGKFVLFVDSDDYIKAYSLQKLLRIAQEKDLDILGFCGDVQQRDGSFVKGFHQPLNIDRIYNGKEAIICGVLMASVCCNLYSMKFIQDNKIAFIEGVTREDVMFNTKAFPLAKRTMFIDYSLYIYTWNPNSIDRTLDIRVIASNIMNDLKVAKYTKDIGTECHDKDIEQIYIKRCNSIICSTILSLMKKETYTLSIKKRYLDCAKAFGLYPIKGRTLSWKTTILIPVINCPIFIKYVLSKELNNKKHNCNN